MRLATGTRKATKKVGFLKCGREGFRKEPNLQLCEGKGKSLTPQ